MAESVELATILLTDLVGSTRLANSVGPVRADELREEHFELLRDAIASSGGREVKNTGDGLMVAFGSASAAVECAVAMQQRFERRYRQAEQALHVRIGLGAGESTVKDGDYFGTPSIVAARLCAQAPSDGILISGMGRALAGRCEGVEFASAGELELKGFEEPVEAFSVSWAPLVEEAGGPSRWALPAVLRSVPPVKYVGRAEERVALEEAMKLARSGERQVVMLSGEPGIGKTRLASYAAHDAHAEGFAVLWGACSEELAVPYEPWIEVCTQIVEHAPEELVAAHVRRHGGELSRLVRSLRERVEALPEPQSSDPETERYLLFNAIVGLLGEVADQVPLCLVLDDLHWADSQSLALLKHLLRGMEHGSLQAIATYRDSDLGKDHPLTAMLADLHSLQGVQRLALHGLDADDVAEVMAAVAGHELARDGVELAAQIAEETDGNPFFVGEILNGLRESGSLIFDEHARRWRIDRSGGLALPESVREVIERRVERLGEESLEPLRLAAVIGREFDLGLLSAIIEMDEGRLLDRLEAAVAASLLAESPEQVGRFRFAHALINQTLYEGLGATRRARMHQRVAEALEDVYRDEPDEHLAELALHWRLAAVSVDKAKAADYSLKAGQRALADLAPAEALKLFGEALELGGDAGSRQRAEALIGLGEAQLQTGESGFRETLLEASEIASALEDPELAARAVLANNRGIPSVIGELDEARLAAAERALELDDPPIAARRARLLAFQALELTWSPDFARRRELADEAISLARSARDPRTLAAVLQATKEPIRAPETLELRTELTSEFLDAAASVQDPALQFWAHDLEQYVYLERGEIKRALAAQSRMREIAQELDQPTLQWIATWVHAGWETLRGDLTTGERLAETAFQIGQDAGQPDAIMVYGGQISFIRSFQGRGQETIEMLRQTARAFPGVEVFTAGLAAALCWLDLHDEAQPILERATSGRFEQIGSTADTCGSLTMYAETAFETSDSRASSLLYELLKPYAGQVAWYSVSGYGHIRLYLGLLASVLGQDDLADEHLQFACQFHEANDMPLWTARGHLGWAEAFAARGDSASAREHAARALELSREHGYGLFEPSAAAVVESESAAGA